MIREKKEISEKFVFRSEDNAYGKVTIVFTSLL